MSADHPRPARSWLRTGTRLLAHPELWPTALRQAGRVAPARWWRRPPFLPLPDREYLRFRLETQYGSAPATDGSGRGAAGGEHRGGVDPDDVLTYLRWCRDQERALRPRGRPGSRTRAGAGRPRR